MLSYSCSRGAFVGASVEGTLMVVRDSANQNFYGERASFGRKGGAAERVFGAAVGRPWGRFEYILPLRNFV